MQTLLTKLLNCHDKILANDLAQSRPWMSGLLFVSGVLAVALGWMFDGTLNKFLLTAGGFALGLAAEKFAEIQKRRIQGRVFSETNSKSQKT